MAKSKAVAPAGFAWAEDTTIEKAREIARLGEMQLEDTISLATSSDQRAATMSMGMSATSAALITAAVAVLGLAPTKGFGAVALLISAACFACAAGFAVKAAWSVDFWLRGYNPSILASLPGDEMQVLKWSAESSADALTRNQGIMNVSGRWLVVSYFASLAGIVLPIAYLLAFHCHQLFFL